VTIRELNEFSHEDAAAEFDELRPMILDTLSRFREARGVSIEDEASQPVSGDYVQALKDELDLWAGNSGMGVSLALDFEHLEPFYRVWQSTKVIREEIAKWRGGHPTSDPLTLRRQIRATKDKLARATDAIFGSSQPKTQPGVAH
jgi:choline dehydrogenase-like flavoprotein